MELKPIKNENDYEQALIRVESLMNAKPNTKDGDELEILSILIENYEKKHYEILPPTPIEAILFRMDSMGLTKKDLAQYIGDTTRVSRVLKGERDLTIQMIKSLHTNLHIPLESLIGVS